MISGLTLPIQLLARFTFLEIGSALYSEKHSKLFSFFLNYFHFYTKILDYFTVENI